MYYCSHVQDVVMEKLLFIVTTGNKYNNYNCYYHFGFMYPGYFYQISLITVGLNHATFPVYADMHYIIRYL